MMILGMMQNIGTLGKSIIDKNEINFNYWWIWNAWFSSFKRIYKNQI